MNIINNVSHGFDRLTNVYREHPNAFVAAAVITGVALLALATLSMTLGGVPGLYIGYTLMGVGIVGALFALAVQDAATKGAPFQ